MWDVLVIFFAQVTYVSLMTLRWILLLKGQRYKAASLSVVEIVIWVYALSLVVGHLGDPVRLLAYALGYASGTLAGTWLEQRLAFGFLTVQVITQSDVGLAGILRNRGFGVTSWRGTGRDGDREILMVVARRRWGKQLYETIDQVAPNAFVLTMEPQGFRGGFLARSLHPGAPVPPGVPGEPAMPPPGGTPLP